MKAAERDALETAEHMKRHSHKARAERAVDKLYAYIEGRKRTAHVEEVRRIADAGHRCLRNSGPGVIEEACMMWACGLDEDLEMFHPRVQKLLKEIFGFV